MKIYSKRTLISGLIGVLIALSGLIALMVKGFDLKLSILLPIILIYSIHQIRTSMSKSLTAKEKVEENDERNQLVELKADSTAFKVMRMLSIGATFMLVILYSIFPSDLLLGMVLTTAFAVFLIFLSSLISLFYYEKRI